MSPVDLSRKKRSLTRHIVSTWLPAMIASFVLSAGVVRSDDDSGKNSDRESAEVESAARLTLMRRRVLSLNAEISTANGNAKVEIIETPLLRYSNHAGPFINPDASVWGWGRTGRPAFIASVEPEGCELVLLSDSAVTLTGKSGLKWTPAESEIKWNRVPGISPASASAIVRARQLKEIAMRFSATGHYGKDSENMELRLLVRHLHRYADPERGLVDGALFAFVAGTNPEVILMLECRQSDQEVREWHYAFARLSSGGLDARLEDKIVWRCPAISHWMTTAPYTSLKFGEEDLAPSGELP